MRKHSLEEFESLFERASIPVFDIPRVSLDHLSVVVTGSELDNTILNVAQYLFDRFSCDVRLYWPHSLREEDALAISKKYTVATAEEPFSDTQSLAERLNRRQSKLVIVPQQIGSQIQPVDLDTIVKAADPPVMVVRQPVGDPHAVFSHVLHSLCGNLTDIRNLAYSFELVSERGLLVLLHTVNADEIEEVRDTLHVSPEISTARGEALIRDLARHAERYLKGTVAATRDEPYEVSYRLGTGQVLSVVKRELERHSFGMLVVGMHSAGKSDIEATEYKLMHSITDIPVLAL